MMSMNKDYMILKHLIRSRDMEKLDNDVIYITMKRLNEIINLSPVLKFSDLIIKNNHVLNYTLYGKEIEIINDDSIIIGGFSLGVVSR